jgi:hypothetical protein
MPQAKEQTTEATEAQPETVAVPAVDRTFSNERLSTTLKTFWTPERKARLKELAIELGTEDSPNYPAAMQRLWEDDSAKAEVKDLYDRTPITG